MKNAFVPLSLALALGAVPGVGSAQEMGRVISSTPVIQQTAVPRQVCTTQAVTSSGSKSGAGAIMGAVAGGAIGNAVGDGTGRAVATMIGLVGGALLGDRVEGPGQPETRNVQTCSTQTFYENRTVSYNVVYEFAGKQYSTSMPHDPGPFVKLQISPISAAPPVSTPPIVTQVTYPTVVREVVVRPAYREKWHHHSHGFNAGFGWGDGRHGPWR